MIKGTKQIQKCKNNYEELGKYERKCFKVLYLNSRSGRIIPISILLEEICPSYLQAQISVSDDLPFVLAFQRDDFAWEIKPTLKILSHKYDINE
jgi:hypothetical protein